MTKEELNALRHPNEFSRFLLTVLVLVPIAIWIAVLIMVTSGILLIYVLSILFSIWFSTKLVAALYLNNKILVSEKSFPKIMKSINESKSAFGYSGEIEAYVYEKSDYNAMLIPLLGKNVILINSELLLSENSEFEIRFIVGRFVGALASKHYRFYWLQAFLGAAERLIILNIFLYPYERAIQYTGDQLGMYFVGGDVNTSISAIVKVVAGQDVASQVDIGGFLEQGVVSRGSFFVWLAQALSQVPHATYRVANLLRFGIEKFPSETKAYIDQATEETKTLIQVAVDQIARSQVLDTEETKTLIQVATKQ